jgi:hypothetical protein
MKFRSKRETFKLKPTPSEGLSGNKISLKGGGKQKKRGLGAIQEGNNEDDPFADLFTGQPDPFDDVFSSAGESAPVMRPFNPKKKKKVLSRAPIMSPASSDSGPDPFASANGPVRRNEFVRSPSVSSGYSSDEAPPGMDELSDDMEPGEDSDSDSEDSGSDSDGGMSVMSGLTSLSSYPLDPALKKMRDRGKAPKQKSKGASRQEPSKGNPYGLSQDELDEAERQDILARFHAMKAEGKVKFSKNYTAKSPLPELVMEMGRIEHQREKEYEMLKIRRQMLVFCGGAERLVKAKFVPKNFRGRLNGFSDYTLSNLKEYDPVFERMTEKYSGILGGGSSGNPLLDLAMVMGTQLFMFFFMNASSSSREPTEEDVRKNHPALIKRIAMEEAEKIRDKEVAEARARIASEQQRNFYGQPQGYDQGYQGVYGGGQQASQQHYRAPPPLQQQQQQQQGVYDMHGTTPPAGLTGGHAPFQQTIRPVPPMPKAPPAKKPVAKQAGPAPIPDIDVSGFSSAPLPNSVETLPMAPLGENVKNVSTGGPELTQLENGMNRLKL